MKPKTFITHAIIFSAGSLLTASYFLLHFVPSIAVALPADSLQIKLSENAEPVDYHPILKKDFLGGLYLRNPLYFFKRQEGYNLLAALAEDGYAGALTNIYAYETDKALRNLVNGNKEKSAKHYQKAYELAILASEHKLYFPLMDLIKTHNLEKRRDISKELKLVEENAKESSRGGMALILSDYYELKADKEKTNYWLDIAQKIGHEKRPEPACATITPWKGW